jgi:chondroitin-sulfate-ABC endolyase/exolyase
MMTHFIRQRKAISKPVMTSLCLTVLLAATACADDSQQSERPIPGQIAADHARIKQCYIRFLIGTDQTFAGTLGAEANRQFLHRLRRPISRALAFDFSRDVDEPFRAFPGEAGHKEEAAVYSPILQQYLLSLAYGYCVDSPGNPHYKNPDILQCYLRCLDYLHGRGIREGMTFHNNENRMNMKGAPKPPPGAANLAEMELRMGALCQSVLLMEPYFRDTPTYNRARTLVRHLEMLGRTSGHVRYYEPYTNPAAFPYRVQSDAIQNYSDTTLVSALLETNPQRQRDLLLEAKRVFTDSLKVIPGWADTIKPDFTGFHHRGIYGNAYTGGFIPQAAFGIHVLRDTPYAVDPQSIENLRKLILTYRLYCQKYAMPFGIRGRMPLSTDQLKTSVFTGVLIYASSLGLDDASMKPVFARLWNKDDVGLNFLFTGGRGKAFRGLYPLEMLDDLNDAAPQPESNPAGFWSKPYGGLALHRRENWMVAVKGYSKYVWDYENGEPDENVYGQYLSHGMLTIFAQGSPVNDVDSGYRLDRGWDWYRMPGTTTVHFPIRPQKPLGHRRFSPETFLGAVSCDGENGAWGMVLNQPTFGDGTRIDLRALKSAFFVDDLIVLLGTDITGGDGVHPVETTLFQSFLDEPDEYRLAPSTCLIDPVGNGYYVPDTTCLSVSAGKQNSYRRNGRTPSLGHCAVAWLDHGLQPRDASYQVAILVRGGDSIGRLAENPESYYRVASQTDALHGVEFPTRQISGLVFFEPGRSDHPIVAQVNEPCLVMCRHESGTHIRLGVANPDLGLLPPESPPPTFRFIAKNENQYLPCQPRPVQVVLRGRWLPLEPTAGVTVVSTNNEQTTLRFNCLHGISVRVELARY